MCVCVCVCVCVHAQSCLTLCDHMDYSLPGSSVHEILQARILEWVAIPFSRESSWPRDGTLAFQTAGRFFIVWATREAPCLVAQSCLTLCDPMDCSLPDFSVHGDFPDKNTGVGCHFLLPMKCYHAINLILGPPPPWPHWNLITSQRPHFQILSLWELGD